MQSFGRDNIFDEVKLLALIRNLDHRWDDISIRMIKICGETLVKALMNIFRLSLNSGIYPLDWKKEYVVPIYKKNR